MVFQQFNLFPHMTALRNVMIAPVTVLHMQESEAAGLAREFLEMVGLADKANSFPRELSGGQQQRVAIARALAMRPHIMLFDEVTSALDPELVGEVLKVIRRLASETSLTMLIVTHEMSFARDVADRVLFLEQGMIEEDSPADIIFSAPRSEATRQFLRATLER
jgi:polar amino acid transport system ATP-binding protein